MAPRLYFGSPSPSSPRLPTNAPVRFCKKHSAGMLARNNLGPSRPQLDFSSYRRARHCVARISWSTYVSRCYIVVLPRCYAEFHMQCVARPTASSSSSAATPNTLDYAYPAVARFSTPTRSTASWPGMPIKLDFRESVKHFTHTDWARDQLAEPCSNASIRYLAMEFPSPVPPIFFTYVQVPLRCSRLRRRVCKQ